jgi:hypothetical protein
MLALLVTWGMGALSAVAMICFDMMRLGTRRVGFPLTIWVVFCLCAWPLAGMVYLFRRGPVKEALLQAACLLVGDQSLSVDSRQQRLIALQKFGLIGQPIFRSCWQELAKDN